MNVRQLIAELQEYDSELPVKIYREYNIIRNIDTLELSNTSEVLIIQEDKE